MKQSAIILALALGVSAGSATAQEQGGLPPLGERPPGRENGSGGSGGFRLLPPPALEQLNLTANQQKLVMDLEAEVRVKLDKILMPEQRRQLHPMRPPQRAGGPGEPGGGPGGLGGPGGMGGQRPVMPIIAALDLNQDGMIDAEETAKASESLKKLDQNGDGKLTPDEYRPPRPGGPGGQPPGNGQGSSRSRPQRE